MLNFLKINSYTFFKMFVYQIGMTIFGLVLSMATQQNDTLFMIASFFSIAFYLFLLYTMTWEIGYEEKIRIDAKRLKFQPFKGLWLSLVANIPNFILGILAVIGYYCATVYKNGAPAEPLWSVNLYGVAKILASFLQAMYSWFYGTFATFPVIFLLIPLPAMLVCTIAYITGVKGKRIFRFLGPDESRE